VKKTRCRNARSHLISISKWILFALRVFFWAVSRRCSDPAGKKIKNGIQKFENQLKIPKIAKRLPSNGVIRATFQL
jgi:hypothetical protein